MAQQKEGTITYERTAQMRINMPGREQNSDQPQIRTDKFELAFANNQSLWKQAEVENEDNEDNNNGGVHVQMIIGGTDDVLYNNFTASKKTELRVVFDKKFIVDDSIHSLNWKMGYETKTILNHVCRKATSTNTSKRTMMNINNGVMERKEINDTSAITAWFATDMPVAAGPAEFQGQLPGVILALDVNNGRMVYKAISISPKADIASIKEPSGKKHYTPEEFKKEREKLMDEMQRNNSGGGRQIRIN